ncbi:MAG: hypothetical protein P8Q26_09960 [Ascidiaceihabitans sp.]|nr:hypothetical protein [Ascidiaceihabitans sp.]
MKHAITLIAMMSAATPALADEIDGLSLMERGVQLFFEGLLQEVEPAMDGLQGFAEQVGPSLQDFATQMGPALGDLMDQVDDWSVYEAPEILPNGDIIIRRKPDANPMDETEI